MQCSILTLLDFSKAYSMVWREKLLLHMLATVIPSTFIHWIWSLFNDQRVRVQLFSFTQGLSQGSVFPTLLFLFYINNLASLLSGAAAVAIFADDVSILTMAHKKDAEAAAQSVVKSVLIWRQEWKLNLNADKSKVCPFSTWSLGPATVLGKLFSPSVLRKFVSTSLLVFSVSF